MKKGAVPIPYIIALLLGISVVAILGYWFFVLGGRWGGEVGLQDCRVKALRYCQTWQSKGGDDPDDWFGEEDGDYPECDGHRNILGFTSHGAHKKACEEILGIRTT